MKPRAGWQELELREIAEMNLRGEWGVCRLPSSWLPGSTSASHWPDPARSQLAKEPKR